MEDQGRCRNDNINKCCVLEGVGEGEFEGKLSQNAAFAREKSMTIKFGNVAIIFWSGILLSFRRLPNCACVVALLSTTVEMTLQMWHQEFPEMKAEVVVVALLRVSIVLLVNSAYPRDPAILKVLRRSNLLSR